MTHRTKPLVALTALAMLGAVTMASNPVLAQGSGSMAGKKGHGSGSMACCCCAKKGGSGAMTGGSGSMTGGSGAMTQGSGAAAHEHAKPAPKAPATPSELPPKKSTAAPK